MDPRSLILIDLGGVLGGWVTLEGLVVGWLSVSLCESLFLTTLCIVSVSLYNYDSLDFFPITTIALVVCAVDVVCITSVNRYSYLCAP